MPRAAIILQARMASVRLPGKALADLAGRSLIGHCLWRLQESGLPVLLATTTRVEDDAIAAEADRYGVEAFRGADQDVLGRYLAAARSRRLGDVIRATGDNPAVDVEAPVRSLALLRRARVDHVIECGLPLGGAVEAVTVDALERSAGQTTEPYDREHVTPFVRRSALFRTLCAVAPAEVRCPGLRLTIDTADDLAFMRRVFEPFRRARRPAPLPDLIDVAERLAAPALIGPAERGA